MDSLAAAEVRNSGGEGDHNSVGVEVHNFAGVVGSLHVLVQGRMTSLDVYRLRQCRSGDSMLHLSVVENGIKNGHYQWINNVPKRSVFLRQTRYRRFHIETAW